MKYTAQLIVNKKIIDTLTLIEDNQKMATRLFVSLGYSRIIGSDDYKIDIFAEADDLTI